MKTTAAGPFFLAVFSLLGSSHATSKSSSANAPDQCAISPKATVSDACASYADIDNINSRLKTGLDSITQTTDFFAYYRLALFSKSCPFWDDSTGMCGNIACAVNTLDNEDDIPAIWRAEQLGKLSGPKAEHPAKKFQEEQPQKPLQGMLGENVGESCVVEYDDECDERDYCVPEDESASGKGDYVSLVDNPERFTGYSGDGAHQVWDAIYHENCFSRASFPPAASLGMLPSNIFQNPAANNLRSALQEGSESPELDECLEKRVFYRVISGMHASISAHLCWDYLNQTTGEWGPNVQCYIERLHNHPERISNLYFNYALVLRAVAKLDPYLKNYTFCSGDPAQDFLTKKKVSAFTGQAANSPQIFDESLMFVNGEGLSLKEDFRNRFRNVSRLMDCVGCDKCRLWGKVQTAGYGAALKVLFEMNEGDVEVPPLKRTELVALFNTLARISNSLSAIGKFRVMVAEATGEKWEWVDEDEEDDFEAWKEEEDIHEIIRKHRATEGMTPMEALKSEAGLVWKVFKHVMGSYLELPQTLWHIFAMEMKRLGQWYLGRPVQSRSWRIKKPNFNDEL